MLFRSLAKLQVVVTGLLLDVHHVSGHVVALPFESVVDHRVFVETTVCGGTTGPRMHHAVVLVRKEHIFGDAANMFGGLIEKDHVLLLILIVGILAASLAQEVIALHHHAASHVLVAVAAPLADKLGQLVKIRVLH